MEIGDELYLPAILFAAQNWSGCGSKNKTVGTQSDSNLESPVVHPII